ncbi:MAG: RrF2 family transcriptional regulator [Oscillospiraceae bacterium]
MSLKISTKGIYGLKVIIDLGQFYNKRLVTVKEISARQGISEKYLEQILNKLNKAGFLESVRGAYGGHRLVVDPYDMTVGMILRALEGDLSPTSCVSEDSEDCDMADSCSTLKIWKDIKDAVDDVVDNITIGKAIEETKLQIDKLEQKRV